MSREKIVKNPKVGDLVQLHNGQYQHCRRMEWFYIDAKIIEITNTGIVCEDIRGKIHNKKKSYVFEGRKKFMQEIVDDTRKGLAEGETWENVNNEEELRSWLKWYFDNGYVI